MTEREKQEQDIEYWRGRIRHEEKLLAETQDPVAKEMYRRSINVFQGIIREIQGEITFGRSKPKDISEALFLNMAEAGGRASSFEMRVIGVIHDIRKLIGSPDSPRAETPSAEELLLALKAIWNVLAPTVGYEEQWPLE